jgi:hypothetical protein
MTSTDYYSLRNDFTGFVSTAFTSWKLAVKNATAKMHYGTKNIH